jgi:hypothetical protein
MHERARACMAWGTVRKWLFVVEPVFRQMSVPRLYALSRVVSNVLPALFSEKKSRKLARKFFYAQSHGSKKSSGGNTRLLPPLPKFTF